jgi:hypothetical protein
MHAARTPPNPAEMYPELEGTALASECLLHSVGRTSNVKH